MKTSLPIVFLTLCCVLVCTSAVNAQIKYKIRPAGTETASHNQAMLSAAQPAPIPEYDASKAACDTLNLALYETSWTIVDYAVTATPQNSLGYVNGVNNYADKAKANFFQNIGGNTYVLGGLIAFSRAYTTTPLTKQITVRIWSSSGGVPGTVLATETFTMQSIMSDVSGGYFTDVVFSNPVMVSGQPFFMGVDFSGPNGLNWATSHDTLSIQSNQDPETSPSAVWEQESDNLWYHYTGTSPWNLAISLAVFPAMSNVPANASFTQSTTNTCSGYPVNYDASGSAPATTYLWKFPGGTPSTSNVVNPTVTYAAAGTYAVKLYILGGSCNNIDSMISSINIIPSPVPNATATPSSICLGQSSTLNAQNGTFYQWSGYPPSPAPTQIVYPTTLTNYTVTVTGSNSCTASQKVTVNVHQLPDGQAAANPTLICLGGSTLLTSAPGMTSYSWSPGGATTSAFVASPTTLTIYTVTVVDGFTCTGTDTVRVVVIPCTGMQEADKEDGFEMIPNPSHGMVDLVFSSQTDDNAYICIYNVEGQLVYSERIMQNMAQSSRRLDLTALPKGVYFLKLTGNRQSFVRKMIIQ